MEIKDLFLRNSAETTGKMYCSVKNKLMRFNVLGKVATHYNTYSNIVKLIGWDDEIEAKEGDVIEYRVKKYDDGVKEIYKNDILIWNGEFWNLIDYYYEDKEKKMDDLDFVQSYKKIPHVNLETCKMCEATQEPKNFNFINDFTNEFIRQNIEYTERELAKLITQNYFIVGSKECRYKLMEILPEGASVVYSPYIDDPTAVYAIRKFDISDLLCKNADVSKSLANEK